MPLQNRLTPFGDLIATSARGTLMGNRGGRLHDPETKEVTGRRWVSRQWIYCVLSFKNRRRNVMGQGYTELFFLDEWTALAAGHRPCFECQREKAKKFAAFWAAVEGLSTPPRAPEMDLQLHQERLQSRQKATHRQDAAKVPNGVMIEIDGQAFLVADDNILPWSPTGYGAPLKRPRGGVAVLTPPMIVAVLAKGFGKEHWP